METEVSEVLSEEEPLQLRCQFDKLTRPDGSIIYCEGETTVLAGIYGPVECKTAKVLTDKAFIEMNYRPKSGLPCVRDRFYESTLKNTCETAIAASLFPRASVVITIQEMHNDGQLMSCAINAACIACLDSGIAMRFMFASTTCFLLDDDSLSFKTPTNRNKIQATFVFAFDSVKGNVIVSHTEGIFTSEKYKQALEKCRNGSKRIFKFIEQEIIKRLGIEK